MCRKVIASKVKVPNVPKVVSEPEFSALVLPRVESPSRIMSHDNTSLRGARSEDISIYDVDVMQRKWHSFVRERKRGNCRHPLTLLRAHLQNGASRDKFLYDKQTRLSGKSYRIFIVQCIALLGRSPFVVRLYSSVRTWKATTRTLPLQDRGGGEPRPFFLVHRILHACKCCPPGFPGIPGKFQSTSANDIWNCSPFQGHLQIASRARGGNGVGALVIICSSAKERRMFTVKSFPQKQRRIFFLSALGSLRISQDVRRDSLKTPPKSPRSFFGTPCGLNFFDLAHVWLCSAQLNSNG